MIINFLMQVLATMYKVQSFYLVCSLEYKQSTVKSRNFFLLTALSAHVAKKWKYMLEICLRSEELSVISTLWFEIIAKSVEFSEWPRFTQVEQGPDVFLSSFDIVVKSFLRIVFAAAGGLKDLQNRNYLMIFHHYL